MGSSMPAVVHYALREGGVELREVPVPAPAEGEVLLRVAAVGVCGSDVHTFHNTQSWPANVPVVLGPPAAVAGTLQWFRDLHARQWIFHGMDGPPGETIQQFVASVKGG